MKRLVKTAAVVAIFTGAFAASSNEREAVVQSRGEKLPYYSSQDFETAIGQATASTLGKTVVRAAKKKSSAPAITSSTTPKITSNKKIAQAEKTIEPTLRAESNNTEPAFQLVDSELNAAAESILTPLEQVGFRVVSYRASNPNDSKFPDNFPTIIISEELNSEEACGGAFTVRRDPNNLATYLGGMAYLGNLNTIVEPAKVHGKEMWNGKIGHPEGSLTEEGTLENSVELFPRLTRLACDYYHTEQRNAKAAEQESTSNNEK